MQANVTKFSVQDKFTLAVAQPVDVQSILNHNNGPDKSLAVLLETHNEDCDFNCEGYSAALLVKLDEKDTVSKMTLRFL